jgi:hypothetical protein
MPRIVRLWTVRTTIDLPDNLVQRAKSLAVAAGVTLDQFLAEAVKLGLACGTPPLIGGPGAPRLGVLTAERIDEAMFG